MTTHEPQRSAPIESVKTTHPSRQFPPCPFGECDGSGWYVEAVPHGHPNFGKLLSCTCRQATAAERMREIRRQRLARFDAEMGGELAGCTLDNYDLGRAASPAAYKQMEAALETCRAYASDADSPIGWLYLYGPTGVGKSHLAAATARTMAGRRNLSIAYASEPALMKYIRDGFGQHGSESTDSRLELLQTVDLLVLDDLGTEYRSAAESPWVDAQILAILMPRYQFERATIITSNLSPNNLTEARIRSRIYGRTNSDYTGREQCLCIKNTDQRNGGAK